MGRTKTSEDVKVESVMANVEEPVVVNEEPLNLEQQVTVRSIAAWTVGFQRLNSNGDVTIPARGATRLSRNEIISQVHNGNTLFNGTNGQGDHATLIIDDKPTIYEISFENAFQFSDAVVKKLFAINDQTEFEESLKNAIVTRAEKYALMLAIVKLKLNDFSKIRFCEQYTGYKFDRVKQDEKNIF